MTKQQRRLRFIEGTEGGAATAPAADTSTTEDTTQDTTTETDESAQTEAKEEIDWKAMARKHEAQAKKNAKAADELEKIRAKGRTAEEAAAKERDDARTEAAQAKAEAARERAARKYGLSDDDLELLEGVPADKFDAKAKALAERIKKAAPPESSGREAGGDRGPKKATSLEGALAAHYNK